MKLHLNPQPDCLLIHSCVRGAGDGSGERHRIRIAADWYEESVIVTPQTVELWDVAAADALTDAHFERLAGLGAEVVILGAGARAVFPPPAVTRPLMARRIGLEVMDTAAACRTYNILAGDGRNPVAALIA